MADQSVTEAVLKRADELVVGDRIQPGYLPAYARSGEGVVRYVELYHYQGADWVFAAFACADGDRNSTYYLPEGRLQVIPVDTGLAYSRPADDPQPSAGRTPPHYGAVEVAGGLVEIDPPESFVPANAPSTEQGEFWCPGRAANGPSRPVCGADDWQHDPHHYGRRL